MAAAVGRIVYVTLVAHIMGARSLGDATTVIAVGTLLSLVTAAGVGPSATRHLASALARDDLDQLQQVFTKTRRAAYILVAVAGVCGGLIYLAAFGNAWIAANLAGFVATYGLYQYYFSVYYGLRKVTEYARSEIVCDTIIIIGAPLAVVGHAFLMVPFFLGYTAFVIRAETGAIKKLRRPTHRLPREPSEGSRAQIWRYAIVSTAGTAASMAGLQLSVAVTRQALGPQNAGLYAAAFALMAPMLYLPRILSTAFLPRAAADLAQDRSDAIRASLAKLTTFLVMVALPLAIVAAALAPLLLRIISGRIYMGAADALIILFAASFFLVASVPAVNVLSARNIKDLAIPFYSSIAGLFVGAVVWAIGIMDNGGIDAVALGVLAGSIVKTVPPVLAVHRRHRVSLKAWITSVATLSIGVGLATGGANLRIFALALGAASTCITIRYLSRITRSISAGQRTRPYAHVTRFEHFAQSIRRLLRSRAFTLLSRPYAGSHSRGPSTTLFIALTVAGSVTIGYLLGHIRTIAGWELIMVAALLVAVAQIRRLGFAHPLIWFTILYALYFLIGAQNWIQPVGGISSFRTHVPTNAALRIPVFGLAAFALGIILTTVIWRKQPNASTYASLDTSSWRVRRAGQTLLVIGVLGLAYTLQKGGILLIHANTRARTPGAATLASLCLAPAGLLLAISASRLRTQLLWIGLCATGLVLLAYRTPVLLLIGSFAIYQLGIGAIRHRSIVVIGLMLLLFGLTVYNLRLSQSSQVIYKGAVVAKGPLEYVPSLTPVYYGFAHEGTAVFSRVEQLIPAQTAYYHGSVQLQALETLLPFGGNQTSTGRRRIGARDIVTELVYGTSNAATSLTPTLVGGPYMDFGVIGVIVEMALFGGLVGWLYSRSKEARYGAVGRLVYAYAATLFALSIHSGLIDGILDVALPLVSIAVYCALGLVMRPRLED